MDSIQGSGGSLSALEESLIAAGGVAQDLRQQLQKRELEVRARASERSEAVHLREQLAQNRLAPLALELCDLEADAHAQKMEVEGLKNKVKRRRVDPSPELTSQIGLTGSVHLNIGGVHFEGNAESLRAGSPFFSLLLSGRLVLACDEGGGIFVDRDGMHFRAVLDFLELGVASVRKHLAVMNRRQRRELAEEGAFYRLPELLGAVAEPAMGSTVAVRLEVKDLVSKGVQSPLLHHACGFCHAPGLCREQPVGCSLLGTATATCIVVEYRHSAVKESFDELSGTGDDGCDAPRWGVEVESQVFTVGQAAFQTAEL